MTRRSLTPTPTATPAGAEHAWLTDLEAKSRAVGMHGDLLRRYLNAQVVARLRFARKRARDRHSDPKLRRWSRSAIAELEAIAAERRIPRHDLRASVIACRVDDEVVGVTVEASTTLSVDLLNPETGEVHRLTGSTSGWSEVAWRRPRKPDPEPVQRSAADAMSDLEAALAASLRARS